MVRVAVSHRHWPDGPVVGRRVGDLVIADVAYKRHEGTRRYFWLLNYGAQLIYEPFGWRDTWYVDMVGFRHGRHDGMDTISVDDEIVDIIVEGHGPTYRLVDLDELAAALTGETLSASAAAAVLTRTQVFLDAFLHRHAPFPPPHLVAWFRDDHQYPPLFGEGE